MNNSYLHFKSKRLELEEIQIQIRKMQSDCLFIVPEYLQVGFEALILQANLLSQIFHNLEDEAELEEEHGL